MADREGVDAEVKEFPLLFLLEKTSGSTQLLLYSIVAVYTLVYLACGIDGNVYPFAKRTYRTNMIGMIVGNQNPHDIMEIQAHLPQVLLYRTRTNTGVNQKTGMRRTEIVAVTATSTGKTPKYETI